MTTATLPAISTTKRVKRLLRPVVRRTLSPALVQSARFRWWYLSKYVPGYLTRRVDTPTVQTAGAASDVLTRLREVNLYRSTRLCRVMTRYGSDKAWNGYTRIYAALFRDRWPQPLRLLEVGLGTNNLDVLSNMGIFGAPGASHRGWRDMFPKAHIFGADIDRRVLFQEPRIRTVYCDQCDPAALNNLWADAELRDGADIIIDDGLHTFDANLSCLMGSLPHLRRDGVYITEDVSWEDVPAWMTWLHAHAADYPRHAFAVVSQGERAHNNVLIAHRLA